MSCIQDYSGLHEALARLGEAYSSHCQSCREKEETLRDFLCNFPSLDRPRLWTIGKPFFEDFREVSNCREGELLSFMNAMD